MFYYEFNACEAAEAKAARTFLISYLRREVAPGSSFLAVEEILAELISNVCKHGGEHARLELHWRRDGTPVLDVVDRGPGVDLSQWQPPSEFSEHGRGLMIVSALSKDVAVAVGPGGKGTRVEVALPVQRRLHAA